ncbi:4'-phosphopantetheinyl transferase family protein [Streptomyces sp. NPDC059002]|uniref:4'-phosphopantetheinyl transferase family protein n=1 Tax=Streptomyces sp. NPDC059002 TaxID=3346690 RepID=UPI0036AEE056
MIPSVVRLSPGDAKTLPPEGFVPVTGPEPSPALFLVHAEDLAGEWERSLAAVLGEEERARAARFHRAADRDTYAVTHLALRLVLGRILEVDPAAVPFTRHACPGCGGPHGRPGVAGDPVHFSLSHSGRLGVVAVAGTPVGVDVERTASAETAAPLVPRLHPAERAELDRLPEPERPGAFTRTWCRKEAYLKGIGTGLSRPLSQDYVSAAPEPAAPPGWLLADVPVGEPDMAAAVAVRRHHI